MKPQKMCIVIVATISAFHQAMNKGGKKNYMKPIITF